MEWDRCQKSDINSFTIIELQNYGGWKEPLEMFKSNSPQSWLLQGFVKLCFEHLQEWGLGVMPGEPLVVTYCRNNKFF